MGSSKRPKGAIVVRSAEAGRLVGFAARGTAEERRQAIKDGLKASKDCQCVCHEPTHRMEGAGAMSDVDRLRAAADRLDGWVLAQITPLDRVYPATAALLRAMAVSNHGSPAWYCDCAVCAAALDLADTILGVGDE